MIRILIVDDIKLMAAVTGAVLGDEEDIQIVGTVTSVEEAITLLGDCDILLASTTLENNGALLLTEHVAASDASVKLVVIGIARSLPIILEYIERGAAGYILKDDSLEELLKNVRAVYNDEALISPRIASALMNRVSELSEMAKGSNIEFDDHIDLTPREVEVLKLIGKGQTNQEIADKLFIELGTVKNHVHSLLNKLSVSSREEAAEYLNLLDD